MGNVSLEAPVFEHLVPGWWHYLEVKPTGLLGKA